MVGKCPKNMRHFGKIGKNLIQTHEQLIQVQFFAISNQKMTLYMCIQHSTIIYLLENSTTGE